MLATATMTSVMVSSSPSYAQAARGYDIPAGTLADVLNAYARHAGIELAYPAELTTGRASGGLKGVFGPAEGLSRILAGTGISFRQTGPRGYTLEAAPTVSAGATQLGPVRVEGEEGGGGAIDALLASEGTKSYAAQAVTIGRQPQTLKEIPNYDWPNH